MSRRNVIPFETAQVKMMDVGLIFAHVVTWIYVLLHTLIEWMRPEEGRDINHHGKSITVGPMQDTDSELFVEGVSIAMLIKHA